jgi:hypothetical protein
MAKRMKETEEVVSGIRRQIRSFEKRAADEDPWTVEEMISLRAELAAAEVRTVARLRQVGFTWADIGFSIGISAITAHKRYSHKIGK